MKRFLHATCGSVLLVVLLATGPAPAQAHTEVCAGTGTMTIAFPLGWVAGGTANFAFTYTVGTCVTLSSFESLSASGVITGLCGLSSGWGTTNHGHNFTFLNTGTVFVMSGEANGAFSFVEDPTDSGSCLLNTNSNFLLTGVNTTL